MLYVTFWYEHHVQFCLEWWRCLWIIPKEFQNCESELFLRWTHSEAFTLESCFLALIRKTKSQFLDKSNKPRHDRLRGKKREKTPLCFFKGDEGGKKGDEVGGEKEREGERKETPLDPRRLVPRSQTQPLPVSPPTTSSTHSLVSSPQASNTPHTPSDPALSWAQILLPQGALCLLKCIWISEPYA